jgi:hypothetical protein
VRMLLGRTAQTVSGRRHRPDRLRTALAAPTIPADNERTAIGSTDRALLPRGSRMPHVRVPCPRCNPQAAGFSWSRNPIGICTNCSGRRYVNAHRLFDPKKPASGLQRALQAMVVVAFALLCLSYASRIMQKVDTLHQERQAYVPPAPTGITYSGGAFLPLVDTDLPAPCVGQSASDDCRSAVEEFRAGYGAIKSMRRAGCGFTSSGSRRSRRTL